jgi:hypothetical protein
MGSASSLRSRSAATARANNQSPWSEAMHVYISQHYYLEPHDHWPVYGASGHASTIQNSNAYGALDRRHNIYIYIYIDIYIHISQRGHSYTYPSICILDTYEQPLIFSLSASSVNPPVFPVSTRQSLSPAALPCVCEASVRPRAGY